MPPHTSDASDAPNIPRTLVLKQKNTRGKIIIILVVVVGLAIWAWEDYFKDRLIPKRFGVVTTGEIYRSGQLHRALVERTLADHQIEVVVNLQSVLLDDPDQMAETAATDKLGILQLRFPLEGDGTGDVNQYIAAIEHIYQSQKNGQRVLVHCHAGSQRTGGVLACYRMLVQGWSPQQTIKEMNQYDWQPEDVEVIDYVNTHLREIADALIQRGVITHAPDPLPQLKW